jgi:SH3 domain protein
VFYKNIITALLAIFFATSVYAETAYVSDIQFVSVREGQDNSTRAVERGLRSGTALQVLERANGHTRVLTPKGNEGWIADYYLTGNKVTREKVIEQEAQITELIESKLTIQKQLNQSSALINQLKKDVAGLTSEKTSLEQKLADLNELTLQAQEIVKDKEVMSFEVDSIMQRLQFAEAEALRLKDERQLKWFIIGAGTLVIGVLFGVIAPSMRRKKANNGAWS